MQVLYSAKLQATFRPKDIGYILLLFIDKIKHLVRFFSFFHIFFIFRRLCFFVFSSLFNEVLLIDFLERKNFLFLCFGIFPSAENLKNFNSGFFRRSKT